MNKQIEKSLAKIAKHYTTIQAIQEACQHPAETLTVVGKSDTGNWCKSDDSYWYEKSCEECGKFWTEDQ